MSENGRAPAERAAQRKFAFPAVNLLLLVPLIGVLIPAIYNRRDPVLLGFPFFYWYQLLWVPLSVVLTVIVYRATKGKR
jgi:uncharacterized protein DUF3311